MRGLLVVLVAPRRAAAAAGTGTPRLQRRRLRRCLAQAPRCGGECSAARIDQRAQPASPPTEAAARRRPRPQALRPRAAAGAGGSARPHGRGCGRRDLGLGHDVPRRGGGGGARPALVTAAPPAVGVGAASTTDSGAASTARRGWRRGRPHRLDQSRRRQDRRRRLRRLGRPRPSSHQAPPGFLTDAHGRLREDVALRQLDAALPREPIDELARDDLLERARRALQLDAVILLEQLQHFLAGRVQQFSDFVNPDC